MNLSQEKVVEKLDNLEVLEVLDALNAEPKTYEMPWNGNPWVASTI